MAPPLVPTIDFAAYDGTDAAARNALVEQIGAACTKSGFFQLVNHGIPDELQQEILEQSAEFFALPMEVKQSYNKDLSNNGRGYEGFRNQNFEKRGLGDLKEGYYFGNNLNPDHPAVVAKKFGQGPNRYPTAVSDPAKFRRVIDTYHGLMRELAGKILRIICKTLDLDESFVDEYMDTPIAVLRLLHYPSQPPDASEHERGIGAHTDFGAITILLQDLVGGLQVWDREGSQWIDVQPVRGAFVVNLGNLFMRWTNDRVVSNLHRVINKSGRERYSIPFFFSGNPDFLVRCFEQCEDPGLGAKYPAVTVGDWIAGRYADTYGTAGTGGAKAMGELSVKEAAAGMA